MQLSLQFRYALLKVIRDSDRAQYKQNARSDLLLDFESVFAAEEHGLHTNDFTSAAQNFNQLNTKPTSPPNTC